jgi:hypothetical protein
MTIQKVNIDSKQIYFSLWHAKMHVPVAASFETELKQHLLHLGYALKEMELALKIQNLFGFTET